MAGALRAARDAEPKIADPATIQVPGAPLGIAIVGISAVDHDIAGREMRRQPGNLHIDLIPRLDHQEHNPGRRQGGCECPMIADDLNPGCGPVAGCLPTVRRHHLALPIARVQRQIAAHHPKADDTQPS